MSLPNPDAGPDGQAAARLLFSVLPCLNASNVAKTRDAPVVAVVGHDLGFPDLLSRLFAHKTAARSGYDGRPDFTATTALRNSSLQGGYLILAAAPATSGLRRSLRTVVSAARLPARAGPA